MEDLAGIDKEETDSATIVREGVGVRPVAYASGSAREQTVRDVCARHNVYGLRRTSHAAHTSRESFHPAHLGPDNPAARGVLAARGGDG